MAIANGLLISKIMHARQKPRKHAFTYGAYYLCFALEELKTLGNTFLSLNQFNLFSFHDRDHASRNGDNIENWIHRLLQEWNITQADGKIVLLTLPRVLGYVFNPVSFWFCLDKLGNLRAVLSEVSNTFGEHHSYLSFHDDHRPITGDDWLEAQKMFHVSPFMKVEGYYRFRFVYSEDKIGVWINYFDEAGMLLATSVTGKRHPLTSANLLKCFFRYPLVTFKVIGLIHFEAVRLLLKRIKYQPKPLPPATEVSK